MAAVIAKAALVATPILVGIFSVFSGGKGSGRPPFPNPIPVPGQDLPFEQVDSVMCLCWQAGETTRASLAACTLARLWPDVPWPSRRGDHPTVVLTSNLVHDRAGAFVDAMAAGHDPCQEVIEPPPAPPMPGPPIADPNNPFAWIRNDARPGSFLPITQGSNPTLVARSVFGYGVGDPRTVPLLQCIVGSGYNLFYYSRARDPKSFGAVRVGTRWYDIGPAWLPRNDNAKDAFEAGVMLSRTVNRTGGKIQGTWSSYGLPWIPLDLQENGTCSTIDPWAPSRNPPPAVLQRRGLDLDTMREQWNSWGA